MLLNRPCLRCWKKCHQKRPIAGVIQATIVLDEDEGDDEEAAKKIVPTNRMMPMGTAQNTRKYTSVESNEQLHINSPSIPRFAGLAVGLKGQKVQAQQGAHGIPIVWSCANKANVPSSPPPLQSQDGGPRPNPKSTHTKKRQGWPSARSIATAARAS
ncbi:hypothetical protein QOT17_013617 [Balamuthia mandrillaris]